jgi:hypothetical protein
MFQVNNSGADVAQSDQRSRHFLSESGNPDDAAGTKGVFQLWRAGVIMSGNNKVDTAGRRSFRNLAVNLGLNSRIDHTSAIVALDWFFTIPRSNASAPQPARKRKEIRRDLLRVNKVFEANRAYPVGNRSMNFRPIRSLFAPTRTLEFFADSSYEICAVDEAGAPNGSDGCLTGVLNRFHMEDPFIYLLRSLMRAMCR